MMHGFHENYFTAGLEAAMAIDPCYKAAFPGCGLENHA